MNKQISLSNLEDELSQVRTKKKEFLEQIERIVPWNEWVAMIKLCYYKGERGNKPYELELMLRLYLIQNLYNLADEATVAEVTDSRAFSDFCGVEDTGRRYAGKIQKSVGKKRAAGKALCTGSRTAYSKRADPEKGNDSRFNDNSSSDFHEKQGTQT